MDPSGCPERVWSHTLSTVCAGFEASGRQYANAAHDGGVRHRGHATRRREESLGGTEGFLGGRPARGRCETRYEKEEGDLAFDRPTPFYCSGDNPGEASPAEGTPGGKTHSDRSIPA